MFDDVMRPEDLAHALKVDVSLVLAALQNGQLRGIALGNQWRILPQHVVDEFRYHHSEMPAPSVTIEAQPQPRAVDQQPVIPALPAPSVNASDQPFPPDTDPTLLPYYDNGITWGRPGSPYQPALREGVTYLRTSGAAKVIGYSEPMVPKFARDGKLAGTIVRYENPSAPNRASWYFEEDALTLYVEVEGKGIWSPSKQPAPAAEPTEAPPEPRHLRTTPPAPQKPEPKKPEPMKSMADLIVRGDDAAMAYIKTLIGEEEPPEFWEKFRSLWDGFRRRNMVDYHSDYGVTCFAKTELERVANSLMGMLAAS